MKKRVLTWWIFFVVGLGFLFLNIHVDAISKDIHDMKAPIHIEFKSEGGFAFIPRLNQLNTVDSHGLSTAQLETLQRLIEKAAFFKLPAHIAAPSSGAADYQHYMITIEQDGHRHQVEFTDLVDNPALKELFAFLKSIQSNQK
jgi:hypothetical protein